ncbi:MAG TPA: glutamine--tRNA ligase/YqeY domain fusion protein [Lutibacter sp.]|nr:glutamine--tRNA ligase/YqeY domain fusion protein [Lutibacter sp.]
MSEKIKSLNFLEQIIEEDLANGLDPKNLRFRFPPEPNGYLHIGHAASICLNFGLGKKYNAPVNLRFDDTNPAKEEQEYVDAIKKDIKWLGFSWDKELYSSDYFEQLYTWAIDLIKKGKAYVDNQTSAQIAEQKGTPTEAGTNSPNRDRNVSENLMLFEKMKSGELEEGTHVLRAKIDMAHVNMHMRDPIMYRSLHKTHHRTGDTWKIYPMYDWTHGESDYLESISHSICTLEFKPHRPLYDWYVDEIRDTNKLRPKQREFARRNLSYTVMSKRKLLQLVNEGHVTGWDDPRMPTISGLRRRGYTPQSIISFSETSGISKRENVTDVALLEFSIREDLNKKAPRVLAVLNPVKVVITNYPVDKTEIIDASYNDYVEGFGSRKLPFSREIYIEKEDFQEEANKKFFRLKLGGEVRLKNAYIIKANDVVKDEKGEITEIHCTYDTESLSGSGTEASKRRVKGTLHWVSIQHAIQAEIRIYDRLFSDEAPDSHKDKSFLEFINSNSLNVNKNAFLEPSLQTAKVGDSFQFQRLGYFVVDDDSTSKNLVFNRTVALKDSWAKTKNNKQSGQSNKPEEAIAKIYPFAGKYLKSREENERQELVATIYDLSSSVSSEGLLHLIKIANTNKEFLTYFMILNSKKVSLDISNSEIFKTLNEFVGKGLLMKNSYVRYRAVDFVRKFPSFKNEHIKLLQVMAKEDLNTKIVELLSGIL